MSTPHDIFNPEEMPPARGFSHAVSAAAGRTIHIAGQIAADASGAVVGSTWAEQFDAALGNVLAALEEAGGHSQHIVDMKMFTTDLAAYRDSLAEIGVVYRRHMGRHYPAMTLVGVVELVVPEAMVEISATAVVPDGLPHSLAPPVP